MDLGEIKKQLDQADAMRSELQQLMGGASSANPVHPYDVGQPYQIRTVTFAYTGVLVAVTPQELVLEQAAWIACTGRLADYLKGDLPDDAEVEPYPDGRVIIGRGAVVDASVRPRPPREQK